MKNFFSKSLIVAGAFALATFGMGCSRQENAVEPASSFVKVEGQNLVKPDGSKLYIVGTNLGNWLNPEGYMFGFQRMNAPRQINELFSELVGPDKTAEFWASVKDHYIT